MSGSGQFQRNPRRLPGVALRASRARRAEVGAAWSTRRIAEIVRADYARVMLLLDDVVFARDFNVSRLVALGARHGLGVVSPRIDHATVPVMRYHRRAGADEVVRMSALETYATLFADARRVELLRLAPRRRRAARRGERARWGYDRCYGPVCDAATGGQALVPGEAAAPAPPDGAASSTATTSARLRTRSRIG